MDKFSSLPAELVDIIISHLPLDQLFVVQLVSTRLWKCCQRLLYTILQQELQDAAIVSFIYNLDGSGLESRYTTRGWRRINRRGIRSSIIVRQMECYHPFDIPPRICRTSEIQCLSNTTEGDSLTRNIPVLQILRILGAKKVKLFAPRPKVNKSAETMERENTFRALPEGIFIYTPGDAASWAMHLIENYVKPFDKDRKYEKYLGLLKSERPIPTSADPDPNWVAKGYYNWRSFSSESSKAHK